MGRIAWHGPVGSACKFWPQWAMERCIASAGAPSHWHMLRHLCSRQDRPPWTAHLHVTYPLRLSQQQRLATVHPEVTLQAGKSLPFPAYTLLVPAGRTLPLRPCCTVQRSSLRYTAWKGNVGQAWRLRLCTVPVRHNLLAGRQQGLCRRA